MSKILKVKDCRFVELLITRVLESVLRSVLKNSMFNEYANIQHFSPKSACKDVTKKMDIDHSFTSFLTGHVQIFTEL